jgi:hypothetical protein
MTAYLFKVFYLLVQVRFCTEYNTMPVNLSGGDLMIFYSYMDLSTEKSPRYGVVFEHSLPNQLYKSLQCHLYGRETRDTFFAAFRATIRVQEIWPSEHETPVLKVPVFRGTEECRS